MREETGEEQAGGVQCESGCHFQHLSYTSIEVNMELLQAQALLAVSLCSQLYPTTSELVEVCGSD